MTFKPLSLTNPINGHARHGVHKTVEHPTAAMVIIHGFGEHSGRYTHMMEHLATQGVATLAIDLEGHGQSQGKRGVCKSYDILQADVELLLVLAQHSYPGKSVFLYGHSMGGGLVLNHVLKHAPLIQGVIASAPLIQPADPVPGALRLIVRILRPILSGLTLKNSISGDKVSTLPEAQARYEADPLNHDRLGIGLAEDIISGGEWVASQAGHWTTPLLLMHAQADKLTDFTAAKAFADHAQNCKFMALKSCEHEIHNDITRDVVYAACLDFIHAQTLKAAS